MKFDMMASLWQINNAVLKKLFAPKPTAKAETAVAASAFDKALALLPWRNQIAGYNIRLSQNIRLGLSQSDFEIAIMPHFANGIALYFIRANGVVLAGMMTGAKFLFVIPSEVVNPYWAIHFQHARIRYTNFQLRFINSAIELYDMVERYRRIGLEFEKDHSGTYRTSPSLLRQRIESERSRKLDQIRARFGK